MSSSGGSNGYGGSNSNANGNGQATEHVPLRRKLYYGSMTFLQVRCLCCWGDDQALLGCSECLRSFT